MYYLWAAPEALAAPSQEPNTQQRDDNEVRPPGLNNDDDGDPHTNILPTTSTFHQRGAADDKSSSGDDEQWVFISSRNDLESIISTDESWDRDTDYYSNTDDEDFVHVEYQRQEPWTEPEGSRLPFLSQVWYNCLSYLLSMSIRMIEHEIMASCIAGFPEQNIEGLETRRPYARQQNVIINIGNTPDSERRVGEAAVTVQRSSNVNIGHNTNTAGEQTVGDVILYRDGGNVRFELNGVRDVFINGQLS